MSANQAKISLDPSDPKYWESSYGTSSRTPTSNPKLTSEEKEALGAWAGGKNHSSRKQRSSSKKRKSNRRKSQSRRKSHRRR
jgi:hypothetical protein